ncbi:MAG: hypothetical protein JWM53_2882 [bacterium]|nr:hypothetical protein [bacterium]
MQEESILRSPRAWSDATLVLTHPGYLSVALASFVLALASGVCVGFLFLLVCVGILPALLARLPPMRRELARRRAAAERARWADQLDDEQRSELGNLERLVEHVRLAAPGRAAVLDRLLHQGYVRHCVLGNETRTVIGAARLGAFNDDEVGRRHRTARARSDRQMHRLVRRRRLLAALIRIAYEETLRDALAAEEQRSWALLDDDARELVDSLDAFADPPEAEQLAGCGVEAEGR